MHADAGWIRWVRVGAAALLLGVQLDGCAGMGEPRSISTPNNTDSKTPMAYQLSRATGGETILVTLRDAVPISGKFREIRRMGSDEYARHVEEFRQALGDTLAWPSPGAPVILIRPRANEKVAWLEGYGVGCLELRSKPGAELQTEAFERFESVRDSAGRVWGSDSLAALWNRGRLPISSALVVETPQGSDSIAIDRIQNVQVLSSGGQWVTAVLVSVGIAVAVILVVASNSHPHDDCPSGPAPAYMERQVAAQHPELLRREPRRPATR